ncbi:SprT family protein [Camelliibacillus cellulosilyticus]|uniref:Protein SprT-like n=1 Tax=Camelliibacillus cellulosilyticus TaxID=2174486 RepID=A0ABV9GPM3_9BACL
MDQLTLQALVEKISLTYFDQPFKHQASFNARLRTTGGRYLLSSHNLEFNPRQLEVHGMDEFMKIIKHELCHYHLHLAGKGYRHKDHDFKDLLKKVGGSRHCQAIPGTANRSRINYIYECRSCGTRYRRRRRIDTKRYVCGICSGRLKLTEKTRIK